LILKFTMELEPTSKPRLPAEQGEKSELKVFQDTIAELRRKETAGDENRPLYFQRV